MEVEHINEKRDDARLIDCFDFNLSSDEIRQYFCKIRNCSRVYKDKSCAIRHIRINHKDVYTTIENNKRATKMNCSVVDELIEIRCKVDPNEIWNACIDLITVHALPLNFVDYPAFKKITEPYVQSLSRHGINLAINRKNIKDRLERKSNKIKQLITSEVRGKLVCLMIDIASRHNRSILGINITYMINNEVVVRTIGMHVLRFTHTATHIANTIKKNLSNYQIDLKQIISVTSDNGKNLIKSIALLDEEYQDGENMNENTTNSTLIFEENGATDDLEIVNSSDDEENIDTDIFDDNYYLDLLANVRSMFDDIPYTNLIHGISCAAHCLHLIITNAIEKSEATKELINKCRTLAKKLRTPTFRSVIHSEKLHHAKVDVNTRWNSIHFMVIFMTN